MVCNVTNLFLLIYICVFCNAKIRLKKEDYSRSNHTVINISIVKDLAFRTPDDPYFYVRGINCSNNTNCPLPSTCADVNTCQCAIGYANFPFNGVEGKFCQYEQKKQLTCFLLELFVGFGAGHFYALRMLEGAFKFALYITPLILCLLMCYEKINPYCGCVMLIFIVLSSIGVICWWVGDAIMFGNNNYKDGNSVPLAQW